MKLTLLNGLAMNIATLSVKGQIVIPKSLRDMAHLSYGDELAMSYVDGELRLRPIASKRHSALDEVAGCLARPNQKAVMTDGDVKAAIKARLKRRHAP